MERQTLQQQVPVYHVCQACGGAGCAVCADLCIFEGDLPAYVLCNDCLRVLPYTDARHQEEEFCTCGGQLCGCGDCHETAAALMAGVRDASGFDFRVGVNLSDWTAEAGIAK